MCCHVQYNYTTHTALMLRALASQNINKENLDILRLKYCVSFNLEVKVRMLPLLNPTKLSPCYSFVSLGWFPDITLTLCCYQVAFCSNQKLAAMKKFNCVYVCASKPCLTFKCS